MREEPSATALNIAASIVQLAADRELASLIPPEMERWSGQFIAEHRQTGDAVSGVRRPSQLLMASLRERLSVPGIRLHFLVRKRFIEELVRQSIASGLEQLVILAGGLDTLAIRLSSEFPAVRFFELDHPATQAIKRSAFAQHALERRGADNFYLLPVDLTKERPDEVLARCGGFEPARRTLVIAEGILMYLTETEIEELFKSLVRLKSREILFSFFETRPGRAIGFFRSTLLTRLWLRWKGEPFRWSITLDELEPFLARHGFELVTRSTTRLLRERYLTELPHKDLAEGEHVALARSTPETL